MLLSLQQTKSTRFVFLCPTKKFLDKEGSLSLQNAAKDTCERSRETVKMKYSNIRSIFPKELKNIKTLKNTIFEFRDVESSFAIPNKTGAKTLRLNMNFFRAFHGQQNRCCCLEDCIRHDYLPLVWQWLLGGKQKTCFHFTQGLQEIHSD